MNLGEVETDVPLNLNNLLIGERYTFYHVNAPNVGIRATLINIIPGHGNIDDRITFNPDVGGIRSVPLHFIVRITQSGIGPNGNISDVGKREINSFLGGRKKRKKRKFRKTKRRRRKTKRRRRKTKRRIKRRCRTRRR